MLLRLFQKNMQNCEHKTRKTGDASFMVWRQGRARVSAKSIHGLVNVPATNCDFFVDTVLTK